MRKRSATVVPSSAREGSGQFMDFASVGMGMDEADKHRAQEDVEVERDGPVLDVVEVVLNPVLHLLDRVSIDAEAVHLSPPRAAGLHASARPVGRSDRGLLLVVRARVWGGDGQAK